MGRLHAHFITSSPFPGRQEPGAKVLLASLQLVHFLLQGLHAGRDLRQKLPLVFPQIH